MFKSLVASTVSAPKQLLKIACQYYKKKFVILNKIIKNKIIQKPVHIEECPSHLHVLLKSYISQCTSS